MKSETCNHHKRLNIRRRIREYPVTMDRRTEHILTEALSNLDGGVTNAEIRAIIGLIQRGLKFT